MVFASCRTSKVSQANYKRAPKPQHLIKEIVASEFNYDWLSAKISGKYKDDGQSFSFKGNIKARKDSIIWMSISPGLGLELGRVLLKTDSIHFLNRFEKVYYKVSYSDLSKTFDSALSFQAIQAILFGNALPFLDQKYYTRVMDQFFLLSSAQEKQIKKWAKSRRKPNIEVHTILLEPSNTKIHQQQIKNYFSDRRLDVNYDDFEIHNSQYFAESMQINLLASKQMNLRLSYSKVQINKPQKVSFKVPASYEVPQ